MGNKKCLVQGSWLTELPTMEKPQDFENYPNEWKANWNRRYLSHLASLPKICRCEGLKDGAIVEEKVDFRRKYNDAYCSNCVNHVCKNPEHILAISTPAASTPAPGESIELWNNIVCDINYSDPMGRKEFIESLDRKYFIGERPAPGDKGGEEAAGKEEWVGWKIAALNKYNWSTDGMKENPVGVPLCDVFILRQQALDILQADFARWQQSLPPQSEQAGENDGFLQSLRSSIQHFKKEGKGEFAAGILLAVNRYKDFATRWQQSLPTEGRGVREQEKYIEKLKALLRWDDCPEIIIENPDFCLNPAKPTKESIEWAQTCIARFEAHKQSESPSATEQREEWVRVEDRLPTSFKDVLIYHKYSEGAHPAIGINIGFWDNKENWVVGDLDKNYWRVNATHWRPLPAPPKPNNE